MLEALVDVSLDQMLSHTRILDISKQLESLLYPGEKYLVLRGGGGN